MRAIVVIASMLLGLELGTRLIVEILWFGEVGYLAVFWRRLLVQLGVGALVFVLSQATFRSSLLQLESVATAPPVTRRLPLWGLLGLVGVLAGALGWLVWGQLQASAPFLQALLPLPDAVASTPAVLAGVDDWPPGAIAAGVALASLGLLRVRVWLRAIALLVSICAALTLAGHWANIWEALAVVPFERTDPLFGRDIGFYIFRLPVLELLQSWALVLSTVALLLLLVGHLLSRNSFSEGRFPGFTAVQLRQIYIAAGGVMLALSLGHALARFEVLYSTRGASYGAGFADVYAQIPLEIACALVAAIVAAWLWLRAVFGGANTTLRSRFNPQRRQLPWIGTPLLAIGFYVAMQLTSAIGPGLLQQLQVVPNELALEEPFIERSINLTRAAFGLKDIGIRDFAANTNLTVDDLRANRRTLENVRLWDSRPLLRANTQLQEIKGYYRFVDADVDRYRLRAEDIPGGSKRQQVAISAREIDYSGVDPEGQTWLNKHLYYTHGYGFTLSPVTEADDEGNPVYFVKDIGDPATRDAGNLQVSDRAIRDSIPINNPRIYYGELTDNYAFVKTEQRELDFPADAEDKVYYNVYDGDGGIPLRGPLSRFLFAWNLRDWQMGLTRSFTPETKVLMRRTVAERIRAIAPFLTFDADPYLVAADPGDGSGSYLHWIIDAYTTSDRYPYSDPGPHPFNYIRNSVKVTVDAYNGKTQFYVADLDDPIVRVWERAFPTLLQPMAGMPPTLRAHWRYPIDLFEAQSERLLIYHMTDPRVFYNREDLWQIPRELYGEEFQAVEPYYLTLALTPEAEEEFVLLLPFTPTQKENAIAALVARSDGDFYGEKTLYQMPRQETILGPRQVESLIAGDPAISQQFSLWNNDGSRAIRGNLLMVPIEESLLYVEPIYLEAEVDPFPTLERVIVVYDDRMAMAPTFVEALEAIFEPGQASGTSTILRPLERSIPPDDDTVDPAPAEAPLAEE